VRDIAGRAPYTALPSVPIANYQSVTAGTGVRLGCRVTLFYRRIDDYKGDDLVMRLARLAGLLLVAVLAVGLLPAASASAAENSNPLFLGAGATPIEADFVGLSGPSTLKALAGAEVACQKDIASGQITSLLLIGKVFIHYLECTAVEKAGASIRCTIKSFGSEGEGLVLTKELHGILGLVLSPAPLDTGILFLPTVGKVVLELAESTIGTVKCTPATKVTGTIAALITPVGVHSFTGLLVFADASIKKIDLTHGLGIVEPALNAFSTLATLLQHDFLEWDELIGVT
jgi:hypothetical protein